MHLVLSRARFSAGPGGRGPRRRRAAVAPLLSSGAVELEYVQAVLKQVEASREQVRQSSSIWKAETPSVVESVAVSPFAAPPEKAPAVAPIEPNLPAPEAASSHPAAPRGPCRRDPLAGDPPSRSPPASPQTSWSDVLAAFMEERNIRWVTRRRAADGLLVRGPGRQHLGPAATDSLFPVHHLRNRLRRGVFLVGLYTHHRWKLPATTPGRLSSPRC